VCTDSGVHRQWCAQTVMLTRGRNFGITAHGGELVLPTKRAFPKSFLTDEHFSR
jgi:hypothetical protein